MEAIVSGRERHNMWRSPEYHSWATMIARCTYKKNPRYSRYGGRGIEVCDRWRNSFINFCTDMGQRPENMTLNRINNDGNYTPENCEWASLSAQARNSDLRSDNTSGHKGVSYYKTRNKWIAYINIGKKVIKLGYFSDIKDAVKARKQAEQKYWSTSDASTT